MKRTVLMLCYYFPPLGGSGVQRSAKFAKYLPEWGWDPMVISVEVNQRNRLEQGLDESLLQDVAEVKVFRCASHEFSRPYRLLHKVHLRRPLLELERLVPLLQTNYKIGWYWSAVQQATKILEQHRINIIYSTSTPYSAHLAAQRLKNMYSLPWVADFRDPWNRRCSVSTPIHKTIERRLEHAIVRDADAIIANTNANKANLIHDFEVSEHKIHVIPNGFDPQDFRPSEEHPVRDFVVSCVGNFYETPDPSAFFKAYRRLTDKYQDSRLRMFGWYSRSIRNAARSILTPGTWEIGSRTEHDKAICLMQASAVLLLNLPNQGVAHWVPGKLYEYLAVGRPILLVGPADGEAANIVRRTRSGVVSGFDENSIFTALESLHRAWQQGLSDFTPLRAEVDVFNRRTQARQLADTFNLITLKQRTLGASMQVPVQAF